MHPESGELPAVSIADHIDDSLDPAERVGWFRYYFANDAWEWSNEVYRMYGYAPGRGITTAILLSHIDSHDRQRGAATLKTMCEELLPGSLRYRIVDTDGDHHTVVMVSDVLRDVDGSILGIQGFYIDVTGSERRAQERITERISQITTRRAIIEQAKGALMAIYGLDSDTAFEVLRTRSQTTNTKTTALARQVLTEFAALSGHKELHARAAYDHAFLTCHQRIADVTSLEATEHQ